MNKKNEVLNYLQKLPLDEKEALEILRNQILQLVPTIVERMSRGVPFFYYKGKRTVGFRSTKTHLSFFIMDGDVLKALKKEITHLDYSSTLIRFSAAHPVSPGLVEKIVLGRIQEIENQLRNTNKKKSL